METDHANDNRGRMKIATLWRSLSWWERIVYVLTALLFALASLISEFSAHRPDGWPDALLRTLNTRLPTIEGLLLDACFPFLVATCVLAARRWWPERWREMRRLWSWYAILGGMGILFAFSAWDEITALATPEDQIPPNLPAFLEVPAMAAGGLILVGMILVIPEFILRRSRATRQQP